MAISSLPSFESLIGQEVNTNLHSHSIDNRWVDMERRSNHDHTHTFYVNGRASDGRPIYVQSQRDRRYEIFTNFRDLTETLRLPDGSLVDLGNLERSLTRLREQLQELREELNAANLYIDELENQ